MDFFEIKESSRRFSLLFGSAFALIIALWSFAVYVLLTLFSHYFSTRTGSGKPWELRLEAPALVLASALLLVMIGASLLRLKRIHDGGSSFIATTLGGCPLGPGALGKARPGEAGDKLSLREKTLGNIVSEMAVAASVSEPDVYVLPMEDGINAMAAGLTEDDAAVIITKGALRRLDRDELSAVIAHEFSHIINGDMRRFTLMAGWLHGLFLLQILARRAMVRLNRPQMLFLALALMALGALGHLSGRLILAAFCRRRETLADATSVQFTRNANALAGALKKIGGHRRGSIIKASAAGGLSHFFVAKPDKASLFSSHPPLSERIWSLDPSWDGWYHDFDEKPVDFLSDAWPPIQKP